MAPRVWQSLSRKSGRVLYYRYLPPNIPLSAIRRLWRWIAEKFDPEKIILFGSFAYGTPHEWKRCDLLVRHAVLITRSINPSA